MEQTMRWFGPKDVVSLSDIQQAGATAVVTALHEYPNGQVWDVAAIRQRKSMIVQHGLKWAVVESVPIHEDIKTRSGDFETYIDAYKETLINLASEGIRTVCYNFMPVLDWTRTHLSYSLAHGGKALRFEPIALAAFDCFILERENAKKEYSPHILKEAEAYFSEMTPEHKKELIQNCIAGLPGAEEGYTLKDFRNALLRYKDIAPEKLAEHLTLFLEAIIPTAEKYGIQMAIHPDDPPFPIFGLARVVSSYNDLSRIVNHPPSPSNGLTFCTGSLGVREDNDLTKIIEDLGKHIHFVHLRSTKRDGIGNFYEANHLEGDVPMVSVIQMLLQEQLKSNKVIPMRPDHGHQLLDDLSKNTNPGYSAIGRLKGLAELRGVMHTLVELQR
ncbi:mannonate dehydratase [Spongiimicrobium salis]|uniref:mannonate dehydratase n=1 Tax=Spongiimicrobium salis TaxID=1667022 RepID=UPI00374D1048